MDLKLLNVILGCAAGLLCAAPGALCCVLTARPGSHRRAMARESLWFLGWLCVFLLPLFLLPPSLAWIAWVFFAAALPAVIGRVNRRYWETLEEAESGRRSVKA